MYRDTYIHTYIHNSAKLPHLAATNCPNTNAVLALRLLLCHGERLYLPLRQLLCHVPGPVPFRGPRTLPDGTVADTFQEAYRSKRSFGGHQ